MTEAEEVPRWRLVLSLVALFASSMCTMGDLVISPIASNIYTAFAGAPEWLIDFGITGPALVGLPFGIITGFLCDRMDKKTIMVIGFTLFTVSSVFGILVENVYYFVIMRLCATGIGWGITNTAALSILADLFTDEDEHGKYVGWYNAAMSLIGALLSSVAGVLAVGAWEHAYFTYLIAIPVLVMLIIFLPKFPARRARSATVDDAAPVEAAPRGWWKKLIPLTVQVFFVATCYYVVLYMVSIYVAETGIGNEAFTGMLTAIMTIAAAVGSLAFGALYKRMKNAVYLPALFVIGAVFFVLAFFPQASVVTVALAVAGLAWPFFFCYFYTHCTELVPAGKQGTATSIVAASNGIAVTVCSYLLMGLIDVTGGCLKVYPIFGVVLFVVGIVSIAGVVISRKRARCV